MAKKIHQVLSFKKIPIKVVSVQDLLTPSKWEDFLAFDA
jgi:hypothetical protein